MKPVRLAIIRTAGAAGDDMRTGARNRRAGATVPPHLAPARVSWLKFGTDVVYSGAGKPWGEFKELARGARAVFSEHPEEVDPKRLHVVIQKGRLFQQAHPEVTVLVDKGRYLLVDLEPERARKLGKGDVPCFAIQPVEALKPTRARSRNRVVFEAAAHARAAAAPDPVIQKLINGISRHSYESALIRQVP
jgi:hypothetical protein